MGDEINARIGELAARLFELRAAQEADLRALTWIQQNLDAIRGGRAPGDPGLLLGEMSRRFGECVAGSEAVDALRADAAALLLRLTAGLAPPREQRPAITVAA